MVLLSIARRGPPLRPTDFGQGQAQYPGVEPVARRSDLSPRSSSQIEKPNVVS